MTTLDELFEKRPPNWDAVEAHKKQMLEQLEQPSSLTVSPTSSLATIPTQPQSEAVSGGAVG